ncbi:hypothetical protein ADUPG1_010845 [Aduncisulcus paluster]|uniref:Uncharacterized protein n=1 Tax=Aduncisulcus paluster TaxID=2918883 RepID=A0ABQ5JT31_9EUKA|nr:hypothetical protein ADUPG1_010845 [Aduncisulcus paluster]
MLYSNDICLAFDFVDISELVKKKLCHHEIGEEEESAGEFESEDPDSSIIESENSEDNIIYFEPRVSIEMFSARATDLSKAVTNLLLKHKIRKSRIVAIITDREPTMITFFLD